MLKRLEAKLATRFLRRSRGVIYVSEHSLGSKYTEEYNLAGSRLIAVLDRGQIKHALVNGKKVSAYHKIKQGDIIDVYVPAGDISGTDIIGFVAAAALVLTGNPAAVQAGIALAVGTGASLISRLLAPSVRSEGTEEDDGAIDRSEIRGAQNTTNKGAMLPVLFGEHLQTPFYGQRAYRLVGDGSATNKYRQLFISNYNDVNMSDEKLGETLVTDFDSEALTVTTSQGGASFIGFDNVLPVSKEEQITIDTEQAVFEQTSHTYNEATGGAVSFTYTPVIEFTNVDISNFPDKTFRVELTSNTGTFPAVQTITSGDLTLVSGTTYRASIAWGSFVFSGTTLVSSTFFNAEKDGVIGTRLNIFEFDNELNVELISEDITVGTYSGVQAINQDCNRYIGLPVQILETTPDNTTDVDINISFSQGLYTQNNDGSVTGRTSDIAIQYRLDTDTVYSDLDTATDVYVRDIDGVKQPLSSSTTTVSGQVATFQAPDDDNQTNELFFRTIGFELPTTDKYVIRVRSADLTQKENNQFGQAQLAEYNFYVDGDPVDTDILLDLNQVAVEAVAYKALSGELQKFNYIGKLEIPIWNGADWNTSAETRNPAAIARYLLTDTKVNPRAEDVSFLDNDSLTNFYDFCETNNYYADGVVTSATKIGAIVAQILDNAKGAFTLVEGKYVFVFDDDTADVLDMFTPHNSWDFKWSPNAGKTTDALRMQFINEDDYTDDEVTLYYYGGAVHETPDAGTSDIDYDIVTQQTQFITNRDHLIDRYTYSLTNIQEKRNFFEFRVNLEGLTRRLFDRVYIANTCDMSEEVSGNIKSVVTSGGNITGFELYSEVDIPAGSTMVVRSIDTANSTSVINTLTVTNSGLTDSIQIDPVPNTGIIKGKGTISGFSSGYEWDYDGDMFEIGVGKVYTALITNIRYNDDLTATIEAREV